MEPRSAQPTAESDDPEPNKLLARTNCSAYPGNASVQADPWSSGECRMSRPGSTRTRVQIYRIMSAGMLAIAAGYATADAREILQAATGEIVVETIADGLEQPWSLAFPA